jgi:integrase/recombinase XerD
MKIITQHLATHLHNLGYRKTTVSHITRTVADLFRYLNTDNSNAITSTHIKQYYDYLHQIPSKTNTGALSEQYIYYKMYALNVFFAWLEDTYQLAVNPISAIQFNRPKRNIRQPLSKDEIQQLFECAVNTSEIVVLHLFYSCGLRKCEAERLNTIDLHLTEKRLYVCNGKFGKRRVIPINTGVVKDISTYLHYKPTTTNEAFMQNTRGARKSGNSYANDLKKIVARAELNRVVSPHYLRHSIATHLLQNGLNVELVRDFLGHKQLETTQIYTSTVRFEI